jgi:streptogrisin C
MAGNGVELMGKVIGSTYPGKDYGWADVQPGWTPRPLFKFWSGYLSLHGADVAAVGATVCRSGPTTGWRCGQVKARNVTVNYEAGKVGGLTRTSACGNQGDSGGPFVFGGQAQGVLSGGVIGDDPCQADTFFQPVRPILANYRLNLLVAGGSLPTVTGMFCDYHGSNNWGCSMNYVAQGAAQITWKVGGVARPAWDNQRVVSGSCTNTLTTISATIASSAASWTETRAVLCLGGGLPH